MSKEKDVPTSQRIVERSLRFDLEIAKAGALFEQTQDPELRYALEKALGRVERHIYDHYGEMINILDSVTDIDRVRLEVWKNVLRGISVGALGVGMGILSNVAPAFKEYEPITTIAGIASFIGGLIYALILENRACDLAKIAKALEKTPLPPTVIVIDAEDIEGT